MNIFGQKSHIILLGVKDAIEKQLVTLLPKEGLYRQKLDKVINAFMHHKFRNLIKLFGSFRIKTPIKNNHIKGKPLKILDANKAPAIFRCGCFYGGCITSITSEQAARSERGNRMFD
jgi:hypothetical protein